jgi:TetR/AcrR family transcriptional regulator, transcriptional repressor of bet genes
MGRPSVAAERRRQIIDAAVECMATHGVSGTTLERIADIAGMGRGHIRHFAGNRDELLIDAARVFFFGEKALAESDVPTLFEIAPLVPPDTDSTGALDYLFGEFAVPGSENAAAFAFVDAGRTIPAIHEIVQEAYRTIEHSLTVILAREFPDADPARFAPTAYAILSLAVGNSYVNDLAPSEARILEARRSAELLVAAVGAPDARG